VQVIFFVEDMRVNGISCSLGYIKKKDGWKMQLKVIMSTEEEVMVFPSGHNFRITVRFLEDHVTLPSLMPINGIHLVFFREL